jgi:hypothetical protein
MNSIGKLEEFEETRDDWTAYIEIVEQYVLANDVADDKKSSSFVDSNWR